MNGTDDLRIVPNLIRRWTRRPAAAQFLQHGSAELSTDTPLPAGCREDFRNLARELADWRLRT
jgi:hypothetical protein